MPKVLILDDDQDFLDILKSYLQDQGFEVIATPFTDDIFTLIKEHQPQLIILDFLINGLNGGEICSVIKKNPTSAFIPVILISAFDRLIYSLGNYGYDIFLSKPFDLVTLFKHVKNLTSYDQV
ncbi:response regulator [Pedobacter glucosidilyticus]|uniref:response regulator n=1 Tax=Pedobacter glucosidilyticus TaxID=1122941 RepID=UPI0004243775|nr:response regulator [Pedobacter glucosidilyticus]